MKFCKNLQQISYLANQRNPEWTPYWVNYKALKKIMLKMPLIVPEHGEGNSKKNVFYKKVEQEQQDEHIGDLDEEKGSIDKEMFFEGENNYDNTKNEDGNNKNCNSNTFSAEKTCRKEKKRELLSAKKEMLQRPVEVAFFRLLHSELCKAKHFFDGAQAQFRIREERIRDGILIVKKKEESIILRKKLRKEGDQEGDKKIFDDNDWFKICRSLYDFNKDLLLLETYAIMSFCAFSKILKKHDKVTGYVTRRAFMEKLVKTANFAEYAQLKQMILNCEATFQEVWDHLSVAKKERSEMSKGADERHRSILVDEDEQLFIHMIEKLNEKARGTKDEGTISSVTDEDDDDDEVETECCSSPDFSRKRKNSHPNSPSDSKKIKLSGLLSDIVDQYGRKVE